MIWGTLLHRNILSPEDEAGADRIQRQIGYFNERAYVLLQGIFGQSLRRSRAEAIVDGTHGVASLFTFYVVHAERIRHLDDARYGRDWLDAVLIPSPLTIARPRRYVTRQQIRIRIFFSSHRSTKHPLRALWVLCSLCG
jgi:hypothetical protein